MPQIVTVTLNPALDKSCEVEYVAAEIKLRCHTVRYDAGGGGINVARVVQRLGGRAHVVWTCGGLTGRQLATQLDAELICHQPIEVSADTRENLSVFEHATGQQYRFGMPGPRLRAGEIERLLAALSAIAPPPAFLVLSGSLPPDTDPGLYRRMAECVGPETRVVLDASGDALRQALQAPLYLIKPNLRELAQLVDRGVEGEREVRDACRQLIATRPVQAIVTSMGGGGALWATADDNGMVHAPIVRIQSKVGAGDSMVGGMVYALAQGCPLPEAVCWGVASGAAAVMTPGTELCYPEDVHRLRKKI